MVSNPGLHEAVSEIVSEKPPGTIIEELEAGEFVVGIEFDRLIVIRDRAVVLAFCQVCNASLH